MHIQIQPNITFLQRKIIVDLAIVLGFNIKNIEYNSEYPYPLLDTKSYPLSLSFSDISQEDLLKYNFPFLSFNNFIKKMIMLVEKSKSYMDELSVIKKEDYNQTVNYLIENNKDNNFNGVIRQYKYGIDKKLQEKK